MSAIVFDLGAVVVRWRPAVLLSTVLPHRVPTPEAAEPWVQAVFQDYGGDWGEFDRGTVTVPQLVERIAARTGLEPAEVLRIVEAVPAELQPLPGTVALIERLRDTGQRLLFLSNMPAPYADHLESAHPFPRWFDGGVFSARVNLIKPDPAIFLHLAEQHALQPERTFFIDDSPRNVAAARALGWQAHRFVDAASLEADLRARGLLA